MKLAVERLQGREIQLTNYQYHLWGSSNFVQRYVLFDRALVYGQLIASPIEKHDVTGLRSKSHIGLVSKFCGFRR